MNPTRACPRCGTPLPADAPQGHCPQCLLALAVQAQPGEATRAALEQATLDSDSARLGVPPAFGVPPSDGSGEGPAKAGTPNPALQFTPGDKVRYFGDYELLEEIARGGMGVVWKARQVSLNRTVALKMILSGSFASDAEVKRFRTEAEAAANLQHPNIVAIHEIGQHEGRHYFSMDYVEGQHLGRFARDNLLSLARIAELTRILAEATQYAHQRGILHRDLKPQNVLMDATGQPRITDFGLAKRIEQASDLTQEGSVMGSPSYMPPEQAGGMLDRISPATDVYSLGAILYELLTGRAPFLGESPVATLRLVLEKEPVRPRRLNERVPVDLETICLKCLEKDPQRRYSTARDLADELGRFLHHESILARPAGRARTAWRGLVRRPWLVTGVIAVLLLGLAMFAHGLAEKVRLLEWKLAHVGEQPDRKLEEFCSDYFAVFLAVEFFLLQSLPLLRFLHWQATGKMTHRRLMFCVVTGLMQVAFGVHVGLKGTSLAVWESGYLNALLSLTVAAFSNVWFGSALAWQGLRSMQARHDITRREVETGATRVRLERPRYFWGALAALFLAQVAVIFLLARKDVFASAHIIVALISGAGAVGIALSLMAIRQARTLAYQSAILPPLLTSCLMTVLVVEFEDLSLTCAWLAFSFGGGLLVAKAGRFTSGPDGHQPSLLAWLRRLLWSRKTAYAVLFVVVFYLVEGLHGWLVWSSAKARVESRGGQVEWSSFVPPPVPDEENVFKHPFMQAHGIQGKAKGGGGFIIDAGFIGHGLEVGPPINLATLKRLPPQTVPPATLVALDPQLGTGETSERLYFAQQPMAEVVQKLAFMAGIQVTAETNRVPFVKHGKDRWDDKAKRWVATNEPVAITFAATNTPAAVALDRLLQQQHLEPEQDRATGVYRLKPVFTSRAELLRRLTVDETAFRQLAEALQRPKAQLDWTAEMPFQDRPRVNYVQRRYLAQTLATRINLHLIQGDPDAALRDVSLLRKLGGLELSSACLVDVMINAAVLGMLEYTLEESLSEGLWPERSLGPLQAEMSGIDLLTPWSQAMQLERAFQIEAMRRVGTPWRFKDWENDFYQTAGGCLNFTWVIGESATEAQKFLTYALIIPPRGWFYQNMARLAEAPDLRSACDPAPALVHSGKAKSMAIEFEAWSSRTPYKLLAVTSSPDFSKSLLTTVKNQTRINLAVVACALEHHRAAKGDYPATLAALVPEFAAKLPHDLFDGQPLRYRRTPDNKYLLYSIGWNAKDDGGGLPADREGYARWTRWADDRGDWVWEGLPAAK